MIFVTRMGFQTKTAIATAAIVFTAFEKKKGVWVGGSAIVFSAFQTKRGKGGIVIIVIV